jgi:site-specific recombinase XerC
LRISDILKLKAYYVNKIMYIRERKTGKHKIVEVSDSLFLRPKELADYTDRSKYAFFSPRSAYKPLHRSTYHRRLKRAGNALCVNLSAHSTRKLYAQNIFRETGDIFAVQKALNHKYITTTAAYLDIDLSALIRAAASKSPT